MKKARKNKHVIRGFRLYNTYWLLKRSFSGIYVKGNFQKNHTSALILVNHSSWWDGLITFYLSETICPFDSYAMMSEQGLDAFPFFNKIGAFSVDTTSATSVRHALRYSTQLLAEEKAVWMFPQGEEQPLEKRPLAFQPGGAFIIKQAPPIPVYFVTYYFVMAGEQKPRLYIDITLAYYSDTAKQEKRHELNLQLEDKLTSQLDRQRQQIAHSQLEEYSTLLTGYRSVSDWFTTWSGGNRS